MGSLQFPNMGMGLRLAAFGRRSSAINGLAYTNEVQINDHDCMHVTATNLRNTFLTA